MDILILSVTAGGGHNTATAGEFFNNSAVNNGIDISQILPFGIPVKPEFLTKVPKKKARLELGLAPDKRTILVMGGAPGPTLHGEYVILP